jgi:antitoxin component of MazEF toxin-antitoxin module
MSKHRGTRLGFPPRYRRRDPRNQARVAAGQALGRQLQGYDLPIRKVRNRNGSRVVTIPSEICEPMGIDFGDELRFSIKQKPSVMIGSLIKGRDVPASRKRGYDRLVRKVTRQYDRTGSKVVTIPAFFCKRIGFDFGTELMFGMTTNKLDMIIGVIKRPDDSEGEKHEA